VPKVEYLDGYARFQVAPSPIRRLPGSKETNAQDRKNYFVSFAHCSEPPSAAKPSSMASLSAYAFEGTEQTSIAGLMRGRETSDHACEATREVAPSAEGYLLPTM
jgi:hypothetical protein